MNEVSCIRSDNGEIVVQWPLSDASREPTRQPTGGASGDVSLIVRVLHLSIVFIGSRESLRHLHQTILSEDNCTGIFDACYRRCIVHRREGGQHGSAEGCGQPLR